MDRKEEELLKKLRILFKDEAEEHVRIISSGLIELEKADPKEWRQIVEAVYREAHSLKGAARSVNLTGAASLCQAMEDVFSALKERELEVSRELFDLLHRAVDEICGIAAAGEEKEGAGAGIVELIRQFEGQGRVGEAEGSAPDLPVADAGAESVLSLSKELAPPKMDFPGQESDYEGPGMRVEESGLSDIRRFSPFPRPPAPGPHPPVPDPGLQAVRLSTHRLDALLLQAEELLTVKIAAAQRITELEEFRSVFELLKKELERAGRTEGGHLFAALDGRLKALGKAAEHDHRSFGGMVDGLLAEMKKTLMLPFASLLDMFPKFVRDLARDLGKEAEIVIKGGEIEVDRRIMEEMRAPLLHLVRNCLDHGIEAPAEREKRGKSVRGTIELAVTPRDGDKLEIVVTDDGAGIDKEELKTAALRHGILTGEEVADLGDRDVLSLMFRSGMTTSSIITDISGRGLGLAIVSEKVEKLNGLIDVDTRPGLKTSFRMVIPLTLATFRGILVQVGVREFILPTTNVKRVLRARKEEIKPVESRETILCDGEVLSLVRLADILDVPRPPGRTAVDDTLVQIIVLGSADRRLAFLMDEVLEEREVLVKPLGKLLSRVRNIAGATVLGDGKVVPILNVMDLMKSAVRAAAPAAGSGEETERLRKSILVVEDSITARTLLKNILNAAGYDVRTAVDGLEAVAALRTQGFDLVVSDVQMPGMDGFDLVKNIRADKKLSELPVVLVTSFESAADRQRGIEAGADAYIVKSTFDQGNLLEVISRLV